MISKYREQCMILNAHKSWRRWFSSNPFGQGFFLYDRFKFIYAYLNEGNKIRECYSCLKMMIKTHLYVGFLKIFITKRA